MRIRDYPGISRWVHWNHRGLCREGRQESPESEEGEGMMEQKLEVAYIDKEGTMSQGMQWKEEKEKNFPGA